MQEVVLLRNPQSLKVYGNTQYAGYVSSWGSERLMVMPKQGFEQDSLGRTSVSTHEVAHLVSRYVLLRQPRWLAEGLAGYYETLKLEDGEATVGRPPDSWLNVVTLRGRLPLEQLWAWDTLKDASDAQLTMLYASSWLWVHYLTNAHPARFADWQQRLGRAEDPQRAWAVSFAGTSPATMEHELMEYCHRIFPVRSVPLPPAASWQVSERAMSDAEVHVVRSQLWLLTPGSATLEQRRAGLQRELDEALRLEPKLLPARVLQVQLTEGDAERLPRARQLVQDQPDSGRAWVLLAGALGRAGLGAEQRSAVERAASLAGTDSHVLNDVAWGYIGQGRASEALPLAERAARLAPWEASYLDTYAAALAGVGRCPEALAMQQRALDSLEEHASEARRTDLQGRRDLYAKGCTARP